MEEKQIESLRKFFTVTLAAFEFSNTVASTLGGTPNTKSEAMKALHKECMDELDKDSPDMNFINSKILEMEILAASPVVQLPKGGIKEP